MSYFLYYLLLSTPTNIFFARAKDKDEKFFYLKKPSSVLQHYSLEYRLIKGITSTNQDAHRQLNEPNRFPSQRQGRENPRQQVTIGFCFNADWLTK